MKGDGGGRSFGVTVPGIGVLSGGIDGNICNGDGVGGGVVTIVVDNVEKGDGDGNIDVFGEGVGGVSFKNA
jgi:hypothetical protein